MKYRKRYEESVHQVPIRLTASGKYNNFRKKHREFSSDDLSLFESGLSEIQKERMESLKMRSEYRCADDSVQFDFGDEIDVTTSACQAEAVDEQASIPLVGTDSANPTVVAMKSESGIANRNTKSIPSCYDLCQNVLNRYSFVNCEGSIYVFDGICYIPTTQNYIKHMILDVNRDIIRSYGRSEAIRNTYEFFCAEVASIHDCPQENQNFVLFNDCRYNLRTGETEPNDNKVFAIAHLDVDYYGSSECPYFDRFLENVSGGDKAFSNLILEIIGYALTPDMNAKKVVVFHGVPHSGKTLLQNIIKSFFVSNQGECSIRLDKINDRFELSSLEGKRLVTVGDCADVPLSPQCVAKIKEITGGDSICIEQKGEMARSIKPTCKIVVASNEPLQIKRWDNAFAERVLGVFFRYSVPNEQRDPDLFNKIYAERSAIAKKALKRYLKLRERNYRFTSIRQEVEALKTSNAPIHQVALVNYDMVIKEFFDNHCELCDTAFAFTQDLYQSFKKYCEHCGISSTNDKDFSTRFGRISGLAKTKRGTKNGYLGVKLKVSEDD